MGDRQGWERLVRLDLFVKGTEKDNFLSDDCSLTLNPRFIK